MDKGVRGLDVDGGNEIKTAAASCWTMTAGLLGWLCLTHLGVMVGLLAGHRMLGLMAVASLLAALAIGDRLGRGLGLSPKQRAGTALGVLGIAAVALVFGVAFFDLSWDGQWYHQVGIYQIARDWNPLTEPLREFVGHCELYVRHYSKGPWYFTAALAGITGNIEWGKAMNIVAAAGAFFAVAAWGLELGMSRARSGALALAAALHPVAWSEMTTFMVDGLMICELTVFAVAAASWLRRPGMMRGYVVVVAMILVINSKFTGLVFVCFACLGLGIYCLIARRRLTARLTGLCTLGLVLGVFVWGYNPYVTNTALRHHPFYPQLGTAKYPSLAAQNEDGIEEHETPRNMMGRGRLVRMAYAYFGQPGNAPYAGEENALLEMPFMSKPASWRVYRFQEVRVAGMGPYFSGALLAGLVLLAWVLADPTMPRWAVGLSCATVAVTLLLNQHFWWPRYGPQMWFMPLIPAAAALAGPAGSAGSAKRRLAWVVIGLMIANAMIPLVIRLKWEWRASQRLRGQLTQLRDEGGVVEYDPRWFGEAIEQRFERWGIAHRTIGRKELGGGTPLMSVVEGYPGEVRYRVAREDRLPAG